jgi:hypothetical protein
MDANENQVEYLRRSVGVARVCLILLGSILILAGGCASTHPVMPANNRSFDFARDTFAFANELVWDYHIDPQTGKTTTTTREPKPDYTHHCFVVARSARQFFQHAQFDPALPVVDDAEYRRRIREVMARSPRTERPDATRVIIPGYADLHSFSAAKENLLKSECGGATQSYFQRGHWRIMLPFTRGHQAVTAERLLNEIKGNRPPVVHIICFPELTINHALLIFDARETETEIQFSVYDPNSPSKPVALTFDRAGRTFRFAANNYFAGGRVNIYEIFNGAFF